MINNIIPGAVLIAALMLSVWLIDNLNRESQRNQLNPSSAVEHFARNLHYTRLNEHGQPSIQLSAPMAKQMTKSHVFILETPKITLFQNGQSPWSITANQAKMLENLKRIVFTGQVQANQAKTQLTADTATLTQNDKHQLQTILAKGKPAHYHADQPTTTHSAQPKGNRRNNKQTHHSQKPPQPLDAFANSLLYTLKTQEVTLSGQAKITQEDNSLRSDHIRYNLKQQTLIATPVTHPQTVIILHPNQLSQSRHEHLKR